ncbi:MAG: ABC transporter substrate-binding protein [Defluviitaleaceae bacterium]|nr:ABC transporter substrate-binding protein [Defluviitaleaceae bacterium]
MKKLFLLLAATALALVAFTACRGDADETDRFLIPAGHPLEMLEDAMTNFPMYGDNGLPHVAGTTFQMGLAHTTPWQGIIGGGGLFSMAAIDTDVAGIIGTTGGLIAMNEFEQFGEGGIVTVAHDMDAQTITLTQHYDVFWHDGAPLTLHDLYFALHILAHPDHQGPRNHRTGDNSDIVGIWEYHNGEADTIEGLVLSNNNRTLTIYFNDFAPTILYFGIWTSPLPYHIFGAYYPDNVAAMIDSPFIRETPIGFGPFEFVHSEPGESFLLRRNENYVWGAPHIEYILIRRIDPQQIAEAMVAGEFDSVGFRTLDFEYHMDPTNWRYFGFPVRATQGHFAFRMGWWCFDTNQNVPQMLNDPSDPNSGYRVHDMMRPEAIYIRRAMAHAIDWLTITQMRYNGLQFPAGAYIPVRHRPLMDLTVPMFPFDREESNRLLDAGGFTTRDSEGYRTWPNGDRMELIWLMMEGPTAEWYYQAHTQAWSDIGLRVSLFEDGFHSNFVVWDLMDFDDDGDQVHFWSGSWQHGANPANSMWSRGEFENASRHNSYELDAILDRIQSNAAWDIDYLTDAMSELQWYMYNNVFYFPTTWGVGLTAVNNRVANWDTRAVMQGTRAYGWHTIRLTAAQPYSG